jgi:hypothetical protein
MRVSLSSVILIAVLAFAEMPAAQQQRQDASRLRPVEAFDCNRNDLTSYIGVVVAYRREVGQTTIDIRTDWETTERVTVRHPGSDDPSNSYRIAGRPFTATDWARIEQSRGVVRAGTRAAAWVCADGRVMVDWNVPKA